MKVFSYALAAAIAFTLTAGTLPAQAQGQEEKPAWMEYKNPYVGEQNDISNANQSSDEVLAWVREMATDVLSFTPEETKPPKDGKGKSKFEKIKPYFNERAWNDYGQYLKESRFLDMVSRSQYNASTIIDGDMVMLSSGALAGAYRWVIQAPLLVTFHSVNQRGEVQPVTSGHFQLVMQVGRTKSDQGKDGLMIDSWKMQQIRK